MILNNLFVKKTLNATSVTLLCATFSYQTAWGMDFNDKDFIFTNNYPQYIAEDFEGAQSWQFEYYEEQPNYNKDIPNNCNDECITTNNSSTYIKKNNKETEPSQGGHYSDIENFIINNNFPILFKENRQVISEVIKNDLEHELEKKKVEKRINKLKDLLLNKLKRLINLDKKIAKELKKSDAKTIVKKLVESFADKLNEGIISKPNFFDSLSTKKLRKDEIKKIVNNLIEGLSSNQSSSDTLPKPKEKINKLEKKLSLTAPKKILPKNFRGTYKNLKNAFKIPKSLPTLTLNELNPLHILKQSENTKITKSMPTLNIKEENEEKKFIHNKKYT